jgi:predicted porin
MHTQKHLVLALAAALTSGAALAQSNVQIYGSIDMGFSHRGDNIVSGVDNKNAIDSGNSDGNRIGFKGSEDLGNGLKALFSLEMGFLTDTGMTDTAVGNGTFSRQAYVGLSSNTYGTLLAGRLYTPQYTFLSAIDPFGEGTVGTFANTFGNDITAAGGTLLVPRLDNAVAYVTPDFSGFNVTAAYSTNGIGQDQRGNSDANIRVYGVLPRYTNGPLDVGVNYHVIDFGKDVGGTLGLDKVRNWTLGGSYDFGLVKLAAFYADTKVQYDVDADLKVKNWMVGASVPFGKHAVLASYNASKAEQSGLSDAAAHQWALGYTYSLSQRTTLYAAYSDINNDSLRATRIARGASTNDASNAGDGYQNGFQFGMRHTF